MLTGGLSVLGVYLFASQDLVFAKASAPTLQKLLKKLLAAVPVRAEATLLVFNVCSKSRKSVNQSPFTPSLGVAHRISNHYHLFRTVCRSFDPADRQFDGVATDTKALSLTKKFFRLSCDYFFEDLVRLGGSESTPVTNLRSMIVDSVRANLSTLNLAVPLDSETQAILLPETPLSEIFKVPFPCALPAF